jgi:hypothetical protein
MSRRLAILGIAFPVSRLVAAAVHAVALALHLATGRRVHGLQLRLGVPGPGVRSDGWCHGLWPRRPRWLPQTWLPRSEKSRRARAATGRVAASPDAAAGVAVPGRQPAASQRLGGATGERRCREHWTRQHRLPPTRAQREVSTATRIAVDNTLTLVSTSILLATSRRGWTARSLISCFISDRGPSERPTTSANKEPRRGCNLAGRGRIRGD